MTFENNLVKMLKRMSREIKKYHNSEPLEDPMAEALLLGRIRAFCEIVNEMEDYFRDIM